MTDALNTTYILYECEWPEGVNLPANALIDLPDWFCLAPEFDQDGEAWDEQIAKASVATHGHAPKTYGLEPYDDEFRGELADYFE